MGHSAYNINDIYNHRLYHLLVFSQIDSKNIQKG